MPFSIACHCGAIRIEVPDAPTEAARCNCTFCHRTGAIWAYYPAKDLAVTAIGPVGDYAPSLVNHHHFCASCGGNTHGIAPDWLSAYDPDGNPRPGYEPGTVPEGRIGAINLRMDPDFDLSSIQIKDMDGRNNW